MPQCAVCHNEYDKAFQVVAGGVSRYFDSIECAAKMIAPTCEHCGCTILGHGVEADGKIFCCAHCAREKGETSLRDRN